MLLCHTIQHTDRHPIPGGEDAEQTQGRRGAEAGSYVTSVVMWALEGRRRYKGMSANSIIILRGLNMADCHGCDKAAFCC